MVTKVACDLAKRLSGWSPQHRGSLWRH